MTAEHVSEPGRDAVRGRPLDGTVPTTGAEAIGGPTPLVLVPRSRVGVDFRRAAILSAQRTYGNRVARSMVTQSMSRAVSRRPVEEIDRAYGAAKDAGNWKQA